MRLALIGAAATLAAATAPAAAQTHLEEIVVTGPTGPDGPSRLSQRVSYADLDLTTLEGQDVLRLRIKDSAETLCRALGEANVPGDALAASCQQRAWRDARPQMTVAVERAFAQATTIVPTPGEVGTGGLGTVAVDERPDVVAQ